MSKNILETLHELESKLEQDNSGQVNETKIDGLSSEHKESAKKDESGKEQAPEEREDIVEKAFKEYKDVDDEHPDESPYVIKKAQAKDDVMTDDDDKSAELIKIEELMADGLGEAFQSMTPKQQEAFKKKGEKTAKEIETLMGKLKLTAKKVLVLLRSWLKVIPGINKYFLEQEAKIKTEEVMHYAIKKTTGQE